MQLYFYSSAAVVGLGLLHEVPRSHSDTPHSVGLLSTSDRHVAQTSDNSLHSQKSPPAVFEPAISTNERT